MLLQNLTLKTSPKFAIRPREDLKEDKESRKEKTDLISEAETVMTQENTIKGHNCRRDLRQTIPRRIMTITGTKASSRSSKGGTLTSEEGDTAHMTDMIEEKPTGEMRHRETLRGREAHRRDCLRETEDRSPEIHPHLIERGMQS